MKKLQYTFLSLVVFIGLTSVVLIPNDNDNWTHFRGSNLDGIAEASHCPVSWSPDSNIAWKTKIHGQGWSSPVVFDDQIWMTTATEDGKEMFAVCVDFNSGSVVHDIKLFTPDSIYRKHEINSYATPTPCIEKDRVYVHFGKYGTACLSTSDATVIWKRNDLHCLHVQGPGASPIIYKDFLILHLEGTDRQLIIALNKNTGETIWETERPAEVYDKIEPIGKKAYITPIIINVRGKDLMISNGSAMCAAYDPTTGVEIWRIVRGEDSTIAMPFTENGIVFFHTGFVTEGENRRFAELMAVNPDGAGDIGQTNVLWRIETPILQLSTPVIKDGLIYNVDTKNIMMCLDATTGETIWSKRLRGKYNSSPVIAAGHVYFSSTNGETTVVMEGRELSIVSENKLEGEIWTTPAVVNNSLLIRTSGFLYKISG
jgi:outer membrane protein assembly factor BamB